ncbi:hypothetical protein [Pontiella sulfatireligans]|uniref:Uncharacterized protein n=1 Tax=Pontiella sulfatireligans TaxID=2750658 RepID=A0A6C2UP99_9BACT|nr:hypothetical protein [Pontiella sulfatireligans]VGO22130.1 hypothetical protein SCARR_04211 [Pontiella sulfatireligans]
MKMRYVFTIMMGLLSVAAQAVVVVDFDAATQILADSDNTPSSFVLNTTTPTYASAGVNYTGPAIYAAMNERSTTLVSLKAANGTFIRMNDSTENGGEALFTFKTPGVSFEAGVDVIKIGSAFVSKTTRLNSATMHFVIEEAGKFYISDASASHATSYRVNALTANWYAYDPSTIAGVSVIGAAATPTFKSIDSIGYLLSAEGPAIGGAGVNFGVTKFTATAAISEPATIGLISASGKGVYPQAEKDPVWVTTPMRAAGRNGIVEDQRIL